VDEEGKILVLDDLHSLFPDKLEVKEYIHDFICYDVNLKSVPFIVTHFEFLTTAKSILVNGNIAKEKQIFW
jgi:hypothetical protein